MKPEPAPVVTMDEDGTAYIGGGLIGEVDERFDPVRIWFSPPARTAAELRALADFLDQLAGANLLSEVVEG